MLVFIIVWALWIVSEFLLNRLLRSSANDEQGKDKNSVRIIWRTIGVATLSGVIFTNFTFFMISKTIYFQYSGLAVIIIGMIFRFFAIWSLGKLFTVDVTIRKDHVIKQDGLYKIIRHPSYLGLLISFLGFGISLNNWISLFVIVIPVTIAMINRIRIEERALTEHFGKDYSEYMKKTCRLIPGIY